MRNRKQVAILSLTVASLAALTLAPIASAHAGPKGEGQKPGKRMEQKMKKRAHKLDKRLDQLVKEGKISEEQKQAIIARLKENLEKRKEIHKIKDLDQRKEVINQLHEDTKKWLQDQGIDIEILKPARHTEQNHN